MGRRCSRWSMDPSPIAQHDPLSSSSSQSIQSQWIHLLLHNVLRCHLHRHNPFHFYGSISYCTTRSVVIFIVTIHSISMDPSPIAQNDPLSSSSSQSIPFRWIYLLLHNTIRYPHRHNLQCLQCLCPLYPTLANLS